MWRKQGSILPAILLAAALGGETQAADPVTTAGAGTPLTPPHIAFQKYKLANGLEVILSEDHRLPLAAVNLWYHVGPANERAGRTGFAHLFEHMMFQGSKHVARGEHIGLLEGAGASDLNGTTDFDRTNYFQTVPSNQLELALWLESDRMGFLLDTLDQSKLTNQKDVVRNERRESIENRPYGVVDEEVFHQLFPPSHPYHADIMGSHADIEAAGLEDVRAFFRQFYVPNNATLAIVGDIDPAKTRALIEKYFGPIPAGAPVPRNVVATPTIKAERRAIVHDKVELPRVYLAWLSAPFFTAGDATADVLAQILGEGHSSRLYKELVYQQQLAQSVSANQESLQLSSVFLISATARPGVTPEKLEHAIDAQLTAIANNGPTPAEMTRAKNQIESQTIRGLEARGVGGIADLLNQYNHYVGNPDYLTADLERHRKVSAAAVQALARSLTPNSRVTVYGVPGERVVNDVARTGSSAPVPAGAAAAAPVATDSDWRSHPPAPGPNPALKLPTPQRLQLPNGLTLLLVEQHQLPVVAANLVVLSGSETNPLDKPGLAAFTAAMLDQGTNRRSALQIADDAAQSGVQLSTGSTSDSATVSVRALTRDLPAAFDLLSDVVLNPTFAPAEIERVRTSRLTELAQQHDNATALANRALAQALYGSGHPYGHIELGTRGSLTAITRDDLVGFWHSGYTPARTALVVAGDLTASQLKELAQRYFGAWSGTTAAPSAPAAPAASSRRIIIIDRGTSPQTALRIGEVGVARNNPDYAALEVMNAALGGIFTSRINLNLRERHGYTYGAGSQFAFRRGPGPFLVGSGVRTDVTAPAVQEIFHELERIRAEPVTAQELGLARDSVSRSLPGDFEANAQTARSIGQLYVYGLADDYYQHLPAALDAVTAQDVLRVASQYVKPDQMVTVAVGDRARIEPGLSALGLGTVEVKTLD